MRKYKIVVEYDGSKYKGWQRLKDTDKTIQCKIETLLSKIIGENIEIHGAGRTDTGVHAYAQVAHFETSSHIDLDKFLLTCNEMLPKDIVIKKIEEVPNEFHARFSAKSKRYVYKIWNSKIPSALNRKFTYYVPEELNLEAMKETINFIIGKHDFSSFTANKSKKKSMVRDLYLIEIKQIGDQIELHFHGEGFLHKMVRIIAGTLIEVGIGEKEPTDIPKIMHKKDRQYAGETAPSQGLYLLEVEY